MITYNPSTHQLKPASAMFAEDSSNLSELQGINPSGKPTLDAKFVGCQTLHS
jgi:hypothetical protein